MCIRDRSRFTLGLDGTTWVRNNKELIAGRAGGIVVESYGDPVRDSLTFAAVTYMEQELQALRDLPTDAPVADALPGGTVFDVQPSFEIVNSFQPGIYDARIYVNPGEPGRIYLRAYEVTREYRLSEGKLNKDSSEWVGWSDDPQQQFYSNTHFSIYEGVWGEPYAARFEVWFEPDSGEPERKLMEKIFKIEGWMR